MLALSPITQYQTPQLYLYRSKNQHLLEANLMLGYLKLKTELLCSTVPRVSLVQLLAFSQLVRAEQQSFPAVAFGSHHTRAS